jgi:hypothetical protein
LDILKLSDIGENGMKRFKGYIVSTILISSALLLGGCGSKSEKWAYAYEPSEEVIELSDNGKAQYKGDKYTYTQDDNFIELKDKSGNVTKLRYTMENDNMVLYEKSTYTYSDGEPGDGIVGLWTQDNGWSYQFTEDGKFSEENIFFGHYQVNEDEGYIRLMYDDPIEDAYIYYTLDGNQLTVDYPWPMVKLQDAKG